MGAVFVAEQIATEARVAIKVLFPHILASQDSVEKFQFEAKVAARVKSEHIVKVLDAGYDNESGLPFLVMELLDGKELDAIVESQGPLSFAETAEYIRQVASGLDKAHGYTTKEGTLEPIVHRDLKPENLFLARRENGKPMVKILDFGIAKVLSDTANVSQEIKGTPLFMAFEQATGKPLSPQTDIWALGLIAFYLMTGEVYWKSASNPEADVSTLFAEVLSLPLDAPSQRATELGRRTPWPEEFDVWFARCVDRNPNARFTSAGEAARQLAIALRVEGQIEPESTGGPATGQHALNPSGPLDATIAGSAHLGATMPAAQFATGEATTTTPGPVTPQGMATETKLALSHTTSEAPPSEPTRSYGRFIVLATLVLAFGGMAGAYALVGQGGEQDISSSEQDTHSKVEASTPAAPPAAPSEKLPVVEQRPAEEELVQPESTPEASPQALEGSPIRATPKPRPSAKPAQVKTSGPKPIPKPEPRKKRAEDPYGER
jgi:serine/threonine-protein kinase